MPAVITQMGALILCGLLWRAFTPGGLEVAGPSRVQGLVFCDRFGLDTSLYAVIVTITTALSLREPAAVVWLACVSKTMEVSAMLRAASAVFLTAVALFSAPVHAGTVLAGVPIPDAVTASNGERLVLNGAGIRKKFFIKVYVGALYLPAPLREAETVVETDAARYVLMHFVHDGVGKKKITDAWEDGFRANLSPAEFEALRERLQRFNAMFEDMHAGERIVLEYVPGAGTRVEVKGVDKGRIEGADFARALMRVWLGEKPADAGLKAGMLGAD